jgi:hypothetical protein
MRFERRCCSDEEDGGGGDEGARNELKRRSEPTASQRMSMPFCVVISKTGGWAIVTVDVCPQQETQRCRLQAGRGGVGRKKWRRGSGGFL